MILPQRIHSEIEEWPGASIVGVEIGRKHHRLTLGFAGRERFVTFSGSPSDRCAENNVVRDVRKTLTELGAVRNERRKASVRRRRNRPERGVLANIQRAPVKVNPFEALAAVQFAAPPKLSWWQRLWARLT